MFGVSLNTSDNIYNALASGNTTKESKPFVTQLEACHCPNEVQEAKIKNVSKLIDQLETTDSIKQIKELKNQIKTDICNIVEKTDNMRAEHFYCKNSGADQVEGFLKENSTYIDRDNYIQQLVFLKEVLVEIERSKYLKDNSLSEYGLGHITAVYGDLKSLDELLSNAPAKVPDLTYNKGRIQFG